MNSKKIIYWIIFLAVVVAFIFISINNKKGMMPDSGESSLEENMQDQNNMQLIEKEGFKYVILTNGSGEGAKSGDIVLVNYTGSLVNGTVFDSSVDPKFEHVEPFGFKLGEGRVIRGWDEGIVGMQVGEKRRLEISPEYAYGDRAIGDIIPANSTLIFEVELLAIENN